MFFSLFGKELLIYNKDINLSCVSLSRVILKKFCQLPSLFFSLLCKMETLVLFCFNQRLTKARN